MFDLEACWLQGTHSGSYRSPWVRSLKKITPPPPNPVLERGKEIGEGGGGGVALFDVIKPKDLSVQ